MPNPTEWKPICDQWMMIAMSMVPVPRVSDCEREGHGKGTERMNQVLMPCHDAMSDGVGEDSTYPIISCTGKIDVRQGDQILRNFLKISPAGVSQQCLQAPVPMPNECHVHAMERRPWCVLGRLWALHASE